MSLLAAGCTHAPQTASTTGTYDGVVGVTRTTAATVAPAPDRRDAAHLLVRAARDLDLTDAQRAMLQAVEDRLDAATKISAGDLSVLRADLAAQVRAGTLNDAKLEADGEDALLGIEHKIGGENDVLRGLHEILTPVQRDSAAAHAEDLLTSQEHRLGEAEVPVATYAGSDIWMNRVTIELGLSGAQQQQVAAVLAAYPETTADYPARNAFARHTRASVEAFGRPDFDPGVVQSVANAGAEVRGAVDREIVFLRNLLPILRPDQRAALATRIESGEWPGG